MFRLCVGNTTTMWAQRVCCLISYGNHNNNYFYSILGSSQRGQNGYGQSSKCSQGEEEEAKENEEEEK